MGYDERKGIGPEVVELAKRGLTDCPRCGSSSVRTAQAHGLLERLLTWLGRFPFRCQDCSLRFISWPISLRDSAFAKCPACLRMDLTVWDPKFYRTSKWQDLLLTLGGHRWRCEPCRRNFVSVRPRRERYRRPGTPADSNRHHEAQPTRS